MAIVSLCPKLRSTELKDWHCYPQSHTMTKIYTKEWGKSLLPVALPSLTGRGTCGCNSFKNRSLRHLNQHSNHDGVFIVHYNRLIWDSCCAGKHMNAFAWIFGTINQQPCWFSGFQTMPSVNQHTVSFLTPTGSCHIWQRDTSRH